MFEVGIGISQNWDPAGAINEATDKALNKLTSKPTFAMLFSTIHYEKNQGLKTILNIAHTKIPSNTPLVGGTVTGFMSNEGCFTRGIVLMLVNSDEMNATIGFGEHTKKDPKTAVEKCSKMIKTSLSEKYNSKFIFEKYKKF